MNVTNSGKSPKGGRGSAPKSKQFTFQNAVYFEIWFSDFFSKCMSRTGIKWTKKFSPYTCFGLAYTKNGGALIPKLVQGGKVLDPMQNIFWILWLKFPQKFKLGMCIKNLKDFFQCFDQNMNYYSKRVHLGRVLV